MALLFMDGFDAKDPGVKWTNAVAGYQGWYGGSSSAFSTGRFGTGFMIALVNYAGQGTPVLKTIFTASNVITVGAALRITGNPGVFFALFGDNGTTTHLQLQNGASGVVQLLRGGSVIASSAANAYINAMQYWEIQASINATTGSVIVKIDGTTVISFTGNTKNGGTNTTIDAVAFQQVDANSTTYIDDVYVLNNTGTVNNNFLGDVRVQALIPSGPGSSTQLSPVGSATNWQNVSDVPYNTSRYNSSSTVGQRDTYALTDLIAGTGTVFGIQTNMLAAKSDAGTAGIKSAIKSGASVYYDATQNLNASPVMSRAVRETDPSTTAAWTVSGVNALEAGAEVA